MQRVVLIDDPPVDSAASVGAQLTALAPPAATEQVRRDPVQPRQGTSCSTAARATLEGERERLCGQLVGEIASSASMEVRVDGTEMPIEDRLERFRLTQRARQAIHIRRN